MMQYTVDERMICALPPHLQRSLPALRQMTPDSAAFIQQSQLLHGGAQPAASSKALTAVVLGGTSTAQKSRLNSSSPGAKGTMHQSPVISLAQTSYSKPGLVYYILMILHSVFPCIV